MTDMAKEWLARAKEDLETVEKLLDDEGLTKEMRSREFALNVGQETTMQ